MRLDSRLDEGVEGEVCAATKALLTHRGHWRRNVLRQQRREGLEIEIQGDVWRAQEPAGADQGGADEPARSAEDGTADRRRLSGRKKRVERQGGPERVDRPVRQPGHYAVYD